MPDKQQSRNKLTTMCLRHEIAEILLKVALNKKAKQKSI
jgi:hypothetical protein